MKCLTLCMIAVAAFVIPVLLHAQESGTVRGVIVEAGSNNRVANANITNKTTNLTVTSNLSGDFQLSAQVGDSLIIRKLGYLEVVTEIKTLSDILIDLKQSSIQIETVTVEQRGKEAEMQEALRGYRKQGVYYEGKPSTLQYIFTPITALYERFGRTPSNARRFRDYMNREMEETAVDKLFNKTRINQLTGLEGDDLVNYMAWYRPSYEKVQHWGEYDITHYIQTSFKQFDRDGRPPAPKLPKLEIPPQEK